MLVVILIVQMTISAGIFKSVFFGGEGVVILSVQLCAIVGGSSKQATLYRGGEGGYLVYGGCSTG
jgi:hypothetical protein